MRIMCLECPQGVCEQAAVALREGGHNVRIARSRDELLEAVRAREVDGVVVPHGDGGGLLNQLRQLSPSLPAIALGPEDTALAAARAGALGALGYVAAPGGRLEPDMADALRILAGRAAARVRQEAHRRREVEERLRLRKFHEDVLNSVGQGILVIDGVGRVVFRNPEAARILGEEPEAGEAAGVPAAVPIVQMLVETLSEERARSRTIALQAGEQKLFLDVTTTVLRQVDGSATGAVAIVSDRSIEKHLEQQLFHSERLATLGSLLASIAHEINNTLTSVTGCAEMGLDLAATAERAARELEDAASRAALEELGRDVRQVFDMVLESGISCQTIANNMLQYSRQAKPAHRVEEDLNGLIRRTLEVLGKHLGVEKVQLELQLDPRAPRVRAEPSKLQQALVNLVVNAVHALLELDVPFEERILALTTRRDDEQALGTIEVRDRGPGIPPKRLEKIFQPFFTTKDHGTGLGLYITRRVIEDLGGSIDVDSQVGVGTCFTLRLPLVGAPAGAPAPGRARVAPRRREK